MGPLDTIGLVSYVCFKHLFHMSASHATDDTPQRLLAAGAEVFGRLGYKAATVRAIVARAKANIGAVNYHFGGKLGLYTAVLKHCVASAIRRYPPDLDLPAGADAPQRLHAFIRATLLRLFADHDCAWHGPLMTREFADPTRRSTRWRPPPSSPWPNTSPPSSATWRRGWMSRTSASAA